MCGKILRAFEWNDSTIRQSRNTMDYHQFKEEENESEGELSTVCSHIVLKCLSLDRIERPDIPWSVNKLARTITKWTKACDKRLCRLISYIHHTSEYRQYCYVGNTAQQCRLGLFQDSDFCRRSWILKINITRSSVHFRASHVCAHKLDVQETDLSFTQFYGSWNNFSWCRFTHGRYSRSHSLGFGDWNMSFRTEREWTLWWNPLQVTKSNMDSPIQFKHTNVIPSNIDHIPSNTMHAGATAMLYVVEDNEAVIKMIIKGRSPTMRHVSRTTELLWVLCLTESIWTQNSKSVTLTPNTNSETSWPKGISRVMSGIIFFICSIFFSSLRCTKNFSLISCVTMAKRIQERVVSKSRPAMNVSSCLIATSSSAASSPIASKSPGMSRFGDRYQNESWSKFIRRTFSVSSEIKGCIRWRVKGRAAGKPDAWERTNFRRIWWCWIWALVLQASCSNLRSLWETSCRRNARIHLFSFPEKSK